MWNTFILSPLINSMIWLYGLLGDNYLLAVIALTIIIKMVTFPTTYQQQKSSLAMQGIQPELTKIRDKYKSDPEEMNKRTMALYREHGVNPAAGCLPMLIQTPILIGLYQAIIQSLGTSPLQLIQLSQRLYQNIPAFLPDPVNLLPLNSNALWLNLATPDSTPILPILVVATSFIQQKMLTPPQSSNTSANDQAQMMRSMSVMMPLMIGVMSLNFPSALSIYWVVSNLVGIIQYATIGNAIGRPSVKTLFGIQEDGSFSLSSFLGLPEPQTEPAGPPGKRSNKKKKKSGQSRYLLHDTPH